MTTVVSIPVPAISSSRSSSVVIGIGGLVGPQHFHRMTVEGARERADEQTP